jgi:acyl dehydratase
MKINIGDIHLHEFSFTQTQVDAFAQVTGDHNPLHLDAEYAANTPFKKPIMHGFLSGSVFSFLLGTQFPGQGSVYLRQNMEFLRPMFVETLYVAKLEVTAIDPAKHTAIIATTIMDKNTKKVTLRGEATVMHQEKIG